MWGSFFESRNRLSVLRGMLGPGADVRIAELFENAPEAYFGEVDREAVPKNTLQVHAAPAHHPMHLRVGTGLHKLLQRLFLLV